MESVLAKQSTGYVGYIVAVSLALWVLYGIIYRLYLHPLARFPGPKLAIVTYWYEFYYDVVKRGRYTWKIKDLHAEYGPIIRINPNELHINDPDYYDEVFPGSGRRIEKPKRAAECFGPGKHCFASVPHELHRLRRSALNPYFSKRSISQYSPIIQGVVDKLCGRLKEAEKTGEPINLQYAYAAMTTDIINEYCFSRTDNAVLAPDFNVDFYECTMVLSQMCHTFKQMPWMFAVMDSVPDWFLKSTNPGMFRVLSDLKSYIAAIDDIKAGKNTGIQSSGHQTLFYAMLNSDLPPQEKESKRLGDEAFGLIGAGTFTTAHMLKITTYHIIANPRIHKKLMAELKSVTTDPDTPAHLQRLEKLSYLTAIINEGLRISYGVSGRLCRASPDRPLYFQGMEIPIGTPVSMTSVLIHDNPEIFPEPFEFRPERWLEEGQQRLQKYLVSFSKGTRMCAGMNLAYAEMYLALAGVFKRFDFKLVDVVRERDVDVTHDFFNTHQALDSKGMNVLVTDAS